MLTLTRRERRRRRRENERQKRERKRNLKFESIRIDGVTNERTNIQHRFLLRIELTYEKINIEKQEKKKNICHLINSLFSL